MEIRQANESDLTFAAALMIQTHAAHVRAYPHRYRPISDEDAETVLRERLEGEENLVVATQDDRRLGYAIFTTIDSPATGLLKSRRFCYLMQIGVDPGARGQGVGRALIRHVREICRQGGIAEIELDVWAFNTAGRRFFEKVGFDVCGTRMRASHTCRRTGDLVRPSSVPPVERQASRSSQLEGL